MKLIAVYVEYGTENLERVVDNLVAEIYRIRTSWSYKFCEIDA